MLATLEFLENFIPYAEFHRGRPIVLANLHVVARVMLGSLFILSGVFKLLAPRHASDFVMRIVPLNSEVSLMAVFAFCILETAMGAMLLVGGKRLHFVSVISTITLLAFTLAGVFMLREPTSCGCFGEILDFKTDGYFLIRNTVFLLISLFILKRCEDANSNSAKSDVR
jgi:uncharacterized membrane protein YphA (DoxX/SURF4 family)